MALRIGGANTCRTLSIAQFAALIAAANNLLLELYHQCGDVILFG